MSDIDDIGGTLRGSHLREIRAEINAAIATSEENQNRVRKKEVAHERAYRILILILGLVISIFPIWLVLEQFNFVDIIPEPPANSTAPTATISDLIGVIIPLLTVVIAFFLGSTGLKRLQIYDSELSQNRSERRSETEKLRAEISRELERGEARAIDASMLRAEGIATQARERLLKTTDEIALKLGKRTDAIKNEIGDSQERYIAKMNIISDEIRAEARKYNWIFADENLANALRDDSIGSVAELHKATFNLFETGKANVAKTLVERHFGADVRSKPDIFGSADDFFNTAVQFAKKDLETLAYRICEGGLHFHPDNADLLSSCMKYALSAGKQERAERLFTITKSLPDAAKNWRVWVFSGDYLEASKGAERAEVFYRDEYLRRFFDEDWELRAVQPADAMEERVFAKLARLYEKSARAKDAIHICRLAVKHIARVPQCAGILGDLLLEAGEYAETIRIANRSLEGDARDQSHVNISAQFMKKANAHDALFFGLVADGGKTDEKLFHARQALIAYSRCLTSEDMISDYGSQLRSRSNSIVAMLESIGVPAAEIREMLPPNIRSMPGVAPMDSGDASDGETTATGETAINDFLIRAKKISVSPENTWPDQIDDMAADVAESGLAVAAATIFQNAANHFDDDHEEVQFVKVLRLLAKRLGGGDIE